MTKKGVLVCKIFSIIISILICIIPINTNAMEKPQVISDINNTTIAEFSDKYFNDIIEKRDIPGVAVIIVKDGKVIHKEGYGYADVEKKILVNPDKTVFRAGSVSKLFTSIASMQLKEQKKIDFNVDINKYLKDVKIDNKYKKPITMENLLTHSAGFDEEYYHGDSGYGVDMNERFVLSVTKYNPKIIRVPGEVSSYSNYGMSLAGYIISSICKKTFSEYMNKNIFEPLNMKESSFDLGPNIIKAMANGYYKSNGIFHKINIYGIPDLPAGGLNTTAGDMGNFILANLQNGKFNNTRILNESSMADMQSTHFKNGKYLGGICYAFKETYINGHRILQHDGSVPGFTSHLVLIPESNCGYFLTINEDANANAIASIFLDFQKQLVNILLPKTTENKITRYIIKKEELFRYKGIYKSTKRIHNSIYKIGDLFGNSFEIKVTNKNDKLMLTGNIIAREYISVASNEFYSLKYDNFIYFVPDENTRIKYLKLDSTTSLEKINWYEQNSIQLIFLVTLLIIFLMQWIISVRKILTKFNRNVRPNKTRMIALIISSLNLSFLIGLGSYFLTLPPSFLFEEEGTPRIVGSLFVRAWLIIPFICIISIILLIATILKESKYLRIEQKVWYTFFAICSILYIIFLNYWCLLGYKFY